MLSAFDRHYNSLIFYGLILLIWFAALANAAYDVWAATFVFAATTSLSIVLLIGRARDNQPIKAPLLTPALIFIGALGITFINTYDMETTWLEFWGYFFCLVIFYLFLNVIRSKQDLYRFFRIAGLIVIPLFLICVWQQFFAPAPTSYPRPTYGLFGYARIAVPFSRLMLGHDWTIRYGQWEIHATLINSVVMAGFILYWSLFYWMEAAMNRLWLVLFFVCLATLILARSWWSLIALLVGFAYHYRGRLWKWLTLNQMKAAGGLVGILLLFTTIVYIKTHHNVERPTDINFYHAGSRWSYWRTALRIWKSSPWSGVGLGGFGTAYPYFKVEGVESTRFAHGLPFQFLSEVGVVGSLSAIGLACAYWKLRSKVRATTNDGNFSSIFDATVLAILIFSLISINMEFWVNKMLFALIIGATIVSDRLKSYRMRPLGLAIAGTGFILIIPYWLNLFVATRLYAAGLADERQGEIATAVRRYQDALSVESFHAESYWELFLISHGRYRNTKSLVDLADARSYLVQAIRYKKDPQFVRAYETIFASPAIQE